MRALDPESDYIVVRSAKSGFVHEHVFLKDLDKMLEGIGESAKPAPVASAIPEQAVAMMTDAIIAVKEDNEQLKARIAALEAIVAVHAENFEVFKTLMGAK